MMDLSFISGYSVEATLVVCLCIGYIIKNIIPSEKINRFIPLIVAVVGVIFNTWSENAFTPDVFITGMASGLASTGLYEGYKQLIQTTHTKNK